jgi:hypothetical protein
MQFLVVSSSINHHQLLTKTNIAETEARTLFSNPKNHKKTPYRFPPNKRLLTDSLFSLSNLHTILSDPLCLPFEIHQMAAALIRGRTVVLEFSVF